MAFVARKPPKNPAKPGPKGISVPQLKAALKKHAGIFALAAQELGCERSNVKHRIDRSPELQAFVAQIEESIGDVAEGVIVSALMAKDRATARWYAERKLRNRGYVTRQEQTGANGDPLPAAQVRVTVEYVDASPGREAEEDVI